MRLVTRGKLSTISEKEREMRGCCRSKGARREDFDRRGERRARGSMGTSKGDVPVRGVQSSRWLWGSNKP
eukprot:3938127-Rhodomonas_salina.7